MVSKRQHFKEHREYWTTAPALNMSIQVSPGFQKRLDWILGNIEGTVLDCGCNDGAYTIEIHKAGHKAVGVDILPEMILKALETCERLGLDENQIDFQVMDIEDLDFDDCQFDCVVLTETLEHLVNPRIGLKEVNRVLKPNGKLLASVPNGVDKQPTHYNTFDFIRLRDLLDDYFKIERLESDFGSFYCVARKADREVGRVLELRPKGRKGVPRVSEQGRGGA